MQPIRIPFKPSPSQLNRSIIERDILTWNFRSSRGLYCRVTNKHKHECHPGTRPKDEATINWLNHEYMMLDNIAKKEFGRRFTQTKDYKKGNLKEDEVEDLIEWLTTEISKCSHFCRTYSTYTPKWSDSSA